MVKPFVHWTREMRNGDIEFYLAANGQVMSGRAATAVTYRDLLAVFEQKAGVRLQAAEVKPPRFKMR
jgi:hypothetical protein